MQQVPFSSGKGRRPAVAVLTAIAALALASCGSRNTYVPPPPPKVVVAKPLQKSVTLYIYLTGNTAAYRTANLVARVQGYLETIDYKDGAAVTKGTQLFGIERDIYQAQLDQNKAQLAKDQAVLAEAQVNLTRFQTLEQQKSIASQQAQDQAAIVEQDKAIIGLDQANVDTATINLGSSRSRHFASAAPCRNARSVAGRARRGRAAARYPCCRIPRALPRCQSRGRPAARRSRDGLCKNSPPHPAGRSRSGWSQGTSGPSC